MKKVATVNVEVVVYVMSDDTPKETIDGFVRSLRAYDLRGALSEGVLAALDWAPSYTLGADCTVTEGE